jgi:hypothetical protein
VQGRRVSSRPTHPPTHPPTRSQVLFIGNPIYEGLDKATAKLQVRDCGGGGGERVCTAWLGGPARGCVQVLKRCPRLAKIDNEMVLDAEREAAAKL